MGFLSNLIDAVRGKREESNPYGPDALTPKDNPPSPTSHDAKYGANATWAQFEAAATGFVPVGSSNVAGIRWFPGTGVLSPVDPANLLKEGPQGGAPIAGDIRVGVGKGTGLVSVAYAHEGKVTDDTYGTLEVMFRGGKGKRAAIYQYLNVPRRVYREMLGAASKGKFVWNRLRGSYAYRRVS